MSINYHLFKLGDKRKMYCRNCDTDREFELFDIKEKIGEDRKITNTSWRCEEKDCLYTKYVKLIEYL